MEVILYKSTDCGACNTVKVLLSNRGVPVTEKNITTDETAFRELADLGFQSVPVIVTSDNSVPPFVGVNMDAINKVAEEYTN